MTHRNRSICGQHDQWRLPGGPARDGDIYVPGDDLFKGPYFVATDKSLAINLLFEALFDLILCCATKMGFPVLSAAEGRALDVIFA